MYGSTHPYFDHDCVGKCKLTYKHIRLPGELTRTGDVENRQLKIVVSEYSKLRRSQFMGSMTLPLAELFEDGVREGWFRLLDAKKGDFQYIPFRPKVKDDTQISVRKGGSKSA